MKRETNPTYRYSIKAKLVMLPYTQRVLIRKQIMRKFGVTKATLSRYVNLTTDETNDMPAMMLVEFSELLNTPTKNLINE
ncbi:MAG: hypothetical protein JST36_07625 [Bacteroidetes bacterium]|nr:hypothetical protein [Bacteroidota bacterium]